MPNYSRIPVIPDARASSIICEQGSHLIRPALVSEDTALTPFMGYDSNTAEKLLRMGVIDENDRIYDVTLSILANIFACNFRDCVSVVNAADSACDLLETAYRAIQLLWKKGEIVGTYCYVLLCCSMIECSAPKELSWIARREDGLRAYMEKFIEALNRHDVLFSKE